MGVYINPPLETINESGNAEGFVIDLLETVAQAEGWSLTYIPCEWAECLSQLESGEIDLMGAIAYSDERAQRFDFNTETYFINWGVIYGRSHQQPQSILDLEGKTLAVVPDDIYTLRIMDLLDQFDVSVQYVEVADYPQVLSHVESGLVDVGVVSRLYGKLHGGDYQVMQAPIVFQPVELHFAATKGRHQEVLTTLDVYLAQWKNTPDSFYYQALQHWLGGARPSRQLPAWLGWGVVGVLIAIGLLAFINALLRREVRRRTAALAASERRYRLLTETAHDIILSHDMQGRITYVNRAGLELSGYRAEEVLNMAITDFIPPEYLADAQERYRRRIAGNNQSHMYTIEYTTANGKRVPLEVRSSPIISDDQATEILIVARDVTERQRAAEERERLLIEIQSQAHHIQQIVDTVPEGVCLLDAEYHLLLTNPAGEAAMAHLCNVQVEEPITHLGNRPLEDILTSPPRGLWHEITADQHIFEVIARPMTNDAPSEQWVLVIRDVTRQRAIEAQLRQQERLAVVGQLAAGIAHDFNNIMATIVLYSQVMVRSNTLPPAERERVNLIYRQAQQATHLIRQILDFSRSAVLTQQPLDLLTLLREDVILLRRTLPENIEVHLTYGSDNYTIYADPTRIHQVVTNLAINARDAMPKGGELRIDLTRVQIAAGEEVPALGLTPGDWVRLRVEDTGTGIPNDVLPHIFEPFFSTKDPSLGAGLGLSQVHGIVGQHNGVIDVETAIGKGTAFTIYLPALAELSTVPQASTEPSGEDMTCPQGHGETILVVEDDPTVRMVITDSLRDLNYRVWEAENGQQALALLEDTNEAVHLVLSDVVMPKMGGAALFYAIRERMWDIPVILMTGHPMEQELEALRQAGLVCWISKPASLEVLSRAIAEALNRDAN